jgi:hypothetical protein
MTSTIDIEERALKLADSFVNGNRTFTVRDIVTEDAETAALLAAHVVYALCQGEEDGPALPPVASAFLIFLARERQTVRDWR